MEAARLLSQVRIAGCGIPADRSDSERMALAKRVRSILLPSSLRAFIPIAEECGLIPKIGIWVREQACREAARWPTEYGVAVNASPSTLRR